MCNCFESNVKAMLLVLFLLAAASLARTFRHGSITFQLAREGIFWIVSHTWYVSSCLPFTFCFIIPDTVTDSQLYINRRIVLCLSDEETFGPGRMREEVFISLHANSVKLKQNSSTAVYSKHTHRARPGCHYDILATITTSIQWLYFYRRRISCISTTRVIFNV